MKSHSGLPDWKNISDRTYNSCPRERLSVSWGPNWGSHWNPSYYNITIGLRGLRGPLIGPHYAAVVFHAVSKDYDPILGCFIWIYLYFLGAGKWMQGKFPELKFGIFFWAVSKKPNNHITVDGRSEKSTSILFQIYQKKCIHIIWNSCDNNNFLW